MSRLRNYALWVSLASLTLLVLQNMGVAVVEKEYHILVNSILTVLVAAGVISNPESGKGYTDEKTLYNEETHD